MRKLRTPSQTGPQNLPKVVAHLAGSSEFDWYRSLIGEGHLVQGMALLMVLAGSMTESTRLIRSTKGNLQRWRRKWAHFAQKNRWPLSELRERRLGMCFRILRLTRYLRVHLHNRGNPGMIGQTRCRQEETSEFWILKADGNL